MCFRALSLLTLLTLLILFAFPVPSWAALAEPPEASAEEEGAAPAVAIGTGTDVVSRYVSRGVASGSGAALQTGVWLSGKNLTLTVWNNLPLARVDGHGTVNEWDYVLAWERPWRETAVELSATRYAYPHQDDAPATTELALTLTRPVGDYEVSVLGLTDVDAYPGAWMAEVWASRTWELSPRLGLEASAGLLWGNGRFHESNSGATEGGFGVITGALSAPYDLGRGLVLRPHLEWHELPDHRIRAAAGDRRYLTVGLALESAD